MTSRPKKIGIVGLGLIGGSLAKAYKSNGDIVVLGRDKDKSIESFAKMSGAIDDTLDEEHFRDCDCIFLALRPGVALDFLRQNAGKIGAETLVIDCCGIKRGVCSEAFNLAKKGGFTFVGGHPMAGRQSGGFKYSKANLFQGASMIIVPEDHNDLDLMGRVKEIVTPAGFSKVTVTSAEEHDRIIAFTSQMAHVVSNAFIKSEAAPHHRGFSAGSYNDLTRVAFLDVDMWTELFLDNKDNLAGEIDGLVERLSEYSKALKAGDEESLKVLLAEGRDKKTEIDRWTHGGFANDSN